MAKVLHDQTNSKILVCCYTNHALDQFIENLMRIGIPSSSIVCLGGKVTAATELLQLETHRTNYWMAQQESMSINEIKLLREQQCIRLQKTFGVYKSADIQNPQLLQHLEFEDPEYFAALTTPKARNGGGSIGTNAELVHDFYLLDRWFKGGGAGLLSHHENVVNASKIWSMSFNERREKLKTWRDALLKEQVAHVYEDGKAYNSSLASIEQMYGKKTEAVPNDKRIIACTMTGAATYGERIRAVCPTVVLVEEAGEILESHILAVLGPKTDQLILIGDHKSVFFSGSSVWLQ